MLGRLVVIGTVLGIGAVSCKQPVPASALKDDTNTGGGDLKMCTEQLASQQGPAPAGPQGQSPAPQFIPPAMELTDGGDFIPPSDGTPSDVLPPPPPGNSPQQQVSQNPSSGPQSQGPSPAPVPASGLARTGRMDKQLAPSLFENMVACNTEIPALPEKDGTINNDGDCEYPGAGGQPFFSCHYHLGIEFASGNTPSRDQSGEIHCIIPNGPKGITVFGGHFTCETRGKSNLKKFDEAGGHGVKGATCSKKVIEQVAAGYKACSQKSCCDDGTLTGKKRVKTPGDTGNPDEVSNLYKTAGLTKAEQGLEIRPDFRLCSQPIVIDCDELAVWGGHKANAPKFGEPGKFWYPSVSDAGRTTYEDAKKKHGGGENHHP